MPQTQHTLEQAANNLGISIDLVEKFIKKGLVIPLQNDRALILTDYNLRQIERAATLYENSCSFDRIEHYLNN